MRDIDYSWCSVFYLQVKLTIRTLPELPAGAKYQCVWGAAPPTDAQVVDQGLKCPAPPLKFRPEIPPRTDHTLVPLAVRSSETNKDFVSRNFAFYDCSRHSTCSSCVRSAWACNWCVYENTCTHNSSTCGGTVVSGENVRGFKLLGQVRVCTTVRLSEISLLAIYMMNMTFVAKI